MFILRYCHIIGLTHNLPVSAVRFQSRCKLCHPGYITDKDDAAQTVIEEIQLFILLSSHIFKFHSLINKVRIFSVISGSKTARYSYREV